MHGWWTARAQALRQLKFQLFVFMFSLKLVEKNAMSI